MTRWDRAKSLSATWRTRIGGQHAVSAHAPRPRWHSGPGSRGQDVLAERCRGRHLTVGARTERDRRGRKPGPSQTGDHPRGGAEVLQNAKTQRWSAEDVLRTLVTAEINGRDAANRRIRLK